MKGILVVRFIIFVVLMPFFAVREFGRVDGEDKLYELFFTSRSWKHRESGAGHQPFCSVVMIPIRLASSGDGSA